ncbi:hypothetical protein C8Q73DRAFT_784873 [Cubamyces lactineus]|nr:hypothetical protein C8Q73DRAFT_784873 [Cubamyces lactineus]
MFWSDNPEGNYVMIEPNLKFMLYTDRAKKHPPPAYYERPPPRVLKALPLDKMRFYPTRRLQNAIWGGPWNHVVADDLDSFSHVFLHTILLRNKQRRDGSAGSLGWAFGVLGGTHPQRLMDWRDEVEQGIWRTSESVKKKRKAGKEPDPATLDAISDELFKVFQVNIGQHGLERMIASGYAPNEKRSVKERAKDHYDEYIQAMENLAQAADAACSKVEEAKREKAERKAAKKAKETEEAAKRKEDERETAPAEEEAGSKEALQEETKDVEMEIGASGEALAEDDSEGRSDEKRDDASEELPKYEALASDLRARAHACQHLRVDGGLGGQRLRPALRETRAPPLRDGSSRHQATVADDLESFTKIFMLTILRRRKRDRELEREECALLRLFNDTPERPLLSIVREVERRLGAMQLAATSWLPGDDRESRDRGLYRVSRGLLALMDFHRKCGSFNTRCLESQQVHAKLMLCAKQQAADQYLIYKSCMENLESKPVRVYVRMVASLITYHWGMASVQKRGLRSEALRGRTTSKACHENVVPLHNQTRANYGFDKALELAGGNGERMLLGLWTEVFAVHGVPEKAVHKWQSEGRLVEGIKDTFGQVPLSVRGSHYPWLLLNDNLLNGRPLSEAEKEGRVEVYSDTLHRTWEFIGGPPSDLRQTIWSKIGAWSSYEQRCFFFYESLVGNKDPTPEDAETWLSFGFTAMTREGVGELVENHDGPSPVTLFLDVTSQSPHMYESVWILKLHIDSLLRAAASGSAKVPHDMAEVDYGYRFCKTAGEKKLLDGLYKEYFTHPDASPPDLHAACIKGELGQYLGRFVRMKPKTKTYMRLLKTACPNTGLGDKAGIAGSISCLQEVWVVVADASSLGVKPSRPIVKMNAIVDESGEVHLLDREINLAAYGFGEPQTACLLKGRGVDNKITS